MMVQFKLNIGKMSPEQMVKLQKAILDKPAINALIKYLKEYKIGADEEAQAQVTGLDFTL